MFPLPDVPQCEECQGSRDGAVGGGDAEVDGAMGCGGSGGDMVG